MSFKADRLVGNNTLCGTIGTDAVPRKVRIVPLKCDLHCDFYVKTFAQLCREKPCFMNLELYA